jgi:outer membrane PBP1 activator LpoA protein
MPAMPPRLLRFSVIAFCVLVSACATTGGGGPRHPEQASTAEEQFSHGDFRAAADAFLALADNDSSGRAHYRLRAAEALREEGELDAVEKLLPEIKRKRLAPDEAYRFDLLDAEIALTHKDAERALTLLTVPDAQLPAALQPRRLELTARAQAMNGDGFGSARTRAALNRNLSGADRDANERSIVDTLAAMPAASLKELGTPLAANDALRPWVEQALRKQGQALPLITLHPGRPVGTVDGGSREGFRQSHHVALLLPLTGALKNASAAIRDGFFAAYFNDHGGGARPEVRTYDSGNTPEEALAAYQHARAEGADRVIGPLSREAVGALFEQPLPVPVLALNQADSGVTPPPGSLAFGLTPDSEGAQVAEHMISQGLKEAAVIAGGEDWAERATQAFRAQFESLGGKVIGEARLKDGEVNFAAAVKQATGSFAGASGTGLFISLRPQQARLLLPQLKLAAVTLPVFGTSHVYAGGSNPGLDRDLDGLEFCDAPWLFDAAPGLPPRESISRTLDSARGAGARLFALGMDAYALLPFMEWLGTHPDSYLPGATGQLASDHFGRVHRLLTWARFDGGVARGSVGGLTLGNAP